MSVLGALGQPRRGHPLLALLGGRRAWGGLDVWPTRYGYTHFRLTVYPPGTSIGERVRHRLWRRLPSVLAVEAMVVLLLCGGLGLIAVEDAAATVVCSLAVVVPIAWTTRRTRRATRSRFGATDECGDLVRESGDIGLMVRWSRLLEWADDELRAGRISPVEHELVWNAAWDALDEPAEHRRRSLRIALDEKAGLPAGRARRSA